MYARGRDSDMLYTLISVQDFDQNFFVIALHYDHNFNSQRSNGLTLQSN